MAVPNTTTFTLQNVVDEINPTTDDLVDCFADATDSNFDTTYSGSKNSLLNFRNYGGIETLTAFDIDGSGDYGTDSQACNLGSGSNRITYYHDGAGTYPIVGDRVFIINSTSFPLQSANWYYIPDENSTIQSSDSGEIINKSTCSSP